MLADGEAARRLAGDGHVAPVAAEAPDVLVHPAQRGLLVEEAGVARLGVERGMREPAEHAEAVVDGHDDRAGVAHQLARVVLAGRAVEVAAAVDPEQHREPAAVPVRRPRAPDVELQAVLVDGGRAVGGLELRARRREAGGVEGAVAARRGGGRGEAPRTHGRRGVGDAAERLDPGDALTAHRSLAGRRDRATPRGGRSRQRERPEADDRHPHPQTLHHSPPPFPSDRSVLPRPARSSRPRAACSRGCAAA